MKNNLISKNLYYTVFACTLLLISCSDKYEDNKTQVITAAGNIQADMDELRNLLG